MGIGENEMRTKEQFDQDLMNVFVNKRQRASNRLRKRSVTELREEQSRKRKPE